MRRGVSSPTAVRVAALVLILLAPATASGCLGDGAGESERLAQPTDAPIVVPRATPAPRQPVFNTSDPGYRVDAPWRVGDGWDYESNQSNVRRMRVIDQRLTNGTTKYLLETKQLSAAGVLESTTRAWIEQRTWLLLNETIVGATVDTYTPGHPVRFWRNGTATYEHERFTSAGTSLGKDSVTLFARLFPVHQTLQFSWGYVEAKRVEHLLSIREADGDRSQITIVHWVHKDYLNDVQFQLPNGELYKLTAAKAGDFRRGQLAT